VDREGAVEKKDYLSRARQQAVSSQHSPTLLRDVVDG
jgi:hypothetical protein